MSAGRHRYLEDRPHSGVSFLLLTSYVLLLAFVMVSCGRRGDPVAVLPYEERGASEETRVRDTEEKTPDTKETEEEGLTVMHPEAPKGLSAVFTGNKVILVWDEVTDRGVDYYRIYRSEGDGFSVIGETATPVFHDRDIEAGVRYFYKVSAVGKAESGLSGAVEVEAGGD